LQEEGKYFELVQLSKWITGLEPRFAQVWAFHAWNLAYNISVLFQDHEDRWRWVRNGISLLRDDGIRYNPGDTELYRELGWFFQHKIGGEYDQANWHYKRSWAAEMALLFEGPRPNYELYTSAPRNRKGLLSQPDVEELVTALEAKGISVFGNDLLDSRDLATDVQEVLETEAGARLLVYLRAQRMIKDYKLLPEIMQEIDEKHGPFDWRLPQAHAIYWAIRGHEYAADFELVATDRMVFQNMAGAFRSGSLVVSEDQNVFDVRPNLDLLENVCATYERAIEAHPEQENMKGAYRFFLIDAVLTLYRYHRMDRAQETFDALAERYPSEETENGLEDFIHWLVAQQAEQMSPHSIISLIEGSLYQGYFWEARGDHERAIGYRELARLCRKTFEEQYPDPALQEHLGLAPMEELQRLAREQVDAAQAIIEVTP